MFVVNLPACSNARFLPILLVRFLLDFVTGPLYWYRIE